MSIEAVTIFAGALGGLICGGLTFFGAFYAVKKGIEDLELSEIRRIRVECITSLYGLRFAITDGFSARPEDLSRFMFEMNRAGALFADDEDTLNGLRDFYDSVAKKKPDATTRLMAMIKSMGKQTSLKLNRLSDADVASTFTLPAAGIIVQFVPVAVGASPNPPVVASAPPNTMPKT